MTPIEAANHYLTLAATDSAAAIGFAHEYEDGASPEDFDAYLDFLEKMAFAACGRCNGSGEIAIRATTGAFVAAGPVPEDARGIAASHCDKCGGTGCVN